MTEPLGLGRSSCGTHAQGKRARCRRRPCSCSSARLPRTDWLRGKVAMEEDCFLLTGRDVQAEDLDAHGEEAPFFLETSQPGRVGRGRRPLRLGQESRLGGR